MNEPLSASRVWWGHSPRLIKAISVCLLSLSLGVLYPGLVLGQVLPPPSRTDETRVRVRYRSLELNPTFGVSDVGRDTNVFNSVDNPQSDFTATFTPGVDLWSRFGRAAVTARGKVDLLYFSRFASERSVDGGFAAKVELPLSRLVPWVQVGSFSGRQRAGLEIDVRSRRSQNDVGLGVDSRITPKTTVGFGVNRSTYAWNGDTFYLGNSLSAGLDRTSDAATLTYRQQLTSLTTFVINGVAARDRFDLTPTRDTDSVGFMAGFDLKARALISGNVRLGARKIDPVGGGLLPFKGLVASASVGYSIHGSTRLDVDLGRQVSFSYDELYPFFVQTGVNVTATHRVYGKWDMQARAGTQNLAYRAALQLADALPSRTDRVNQFGAGAGYRLNQTTRIGLNFDRIRRSSPIQARDYQSLRIGFAVTYIG